MCLCAFCYKSDCLETSQYVCLLLVFCFPELRLKYLLVQISFIDLLNQGKLRKRKQKGKVISTWDLGTERKTISKLYSTMVKVISQPNLMLQDNYCVTQNQGCEFD